MTKSAALSIIDSYKYLCWYRGSWGWRIRVGGEGTSTEVLHRRSRKVAGYPASLLLVEVAQGSTGEQAGHRAVHPLLVEAVQRCRKVVEAHLPRLSETHTSAKYNQRCVKSVFHRFHNLVEI